MTIALSIQPFYDTMVKQDLDAIKRRGTSRSAIHSYKPRLKARRPAKSFRRRCADSRATRGDLAVSACVVARAFHMIGDPVAWLKRPGILARIVTIWAMPKSLKQSRESLSAEPGPAPCAQRSLARLGPSLMLNIAKPGA